MFKTIKEWFDWGDEPVNEIAEWHEKTLDCIQQIEAGEITIDGKRAEVTLIWCVVNFIDYLESEFEKYSKYDLQNLISLIFMAFKRMSDLTYREIIELFPVRIRYERADTKYFNATDIPAFQAPDDTGFDSIIKSFGSIGIITLCRSGLHFGDETEGTTDFDSKIGDNIMKYAANFLNSELGLFYYCFICAAHNFYLYD